LFCRVFIVLLCLFGSTLAVKYDLECEIKNISYYRLYETSNNTMIPTCELKYVKYSAGKTLKYNVTSDDPAVMRVTIAESVVQSIPTAVFKKFEFVNHLEMNGVGLRSITSNSFANAKSLETFQAFGNKMTIIYGYSFVGADQLKVLDLSSNQISNINHEAFSGLDELVSLGLSDNRISIIDDNTFHPLKNLKWIWLDRNEIKIVSASLLINSVNLEGIYLNDNKISALSPVLFDQLPELNYLFLAANNCTNMNFIDNMVPNNANVKKELVKCYVEYRTIIPDEEDKFKFGSKLLAAESASLQCEADKAALLEQLEAKKQELAKLQSKKNGK
jgi:Leucine-rich repeat (LRR) protein